MTRDDGEGNAMSTEDKARALGRERGVSAGTWVIDGNTSIETIRAIAKGIDEGDPAIMDMQPSPLSGEWADAPTIGDVLRELEVSEDDDAADDLLTVYEDGYSEGYWHEVETTVRYHLEGEQ